MNSVLTLYGLLQMARVKRNLLPTTKRMKARRPTAELNLSSFNKSNLKPYKMKKISSLLIAALSLLILCNTAAAQKDTSAVYKTFDDLFATIKKSKRTGIRTDPRLSAISKQWVAEISKTISAKPASEPWKEWTS